MHVDFHNTITGLQPPSTTKYRQQTEQGGHGQTATGLCAMDQPHHPVYLHSQYRQIRIQLPRLTSDKLTFPSPGYAFNAGLTDWKCTLALNSECEPGSLVSLYLHKQTFKKKTYFLNTIPVSFPRKPSCWK